MNQNNLPVLNIDFKELPEYSDAKSRQEAIVEANPFVVVSDNASHDLAKKRRTALRQGRYELQKGEKIIASKIKDFRDFVKVETQNLINITLTHEEKQQSEIDRYEAEKKREREEKARIERERIRNIETGLISFRESFRQLIAKATLNTIDGITSDIQEHEMKCDEFADNLESIRTELLAFANEKKAQLEEAEKLRVEREKMEAERKALEAERKAQEEKSRKEREAQERKAKEEREKLEAERKEQDEKLRKEREAQEAKLKAEREEIEAEKARLAKIEADKKASEEAERKAKEEAERKEKEAAELKAKEEAEKKRQEALKPDKEKLLKVIRSLSIDLDPSVQFQSKEIENIAVDYVEQADKLMQQFIDKVNNL